MAGTSDYFPRADAWLEEYDACHVLLRKLNAIYTETLEENRALRLESEQRYNGCSEQRYNGHSAEATPSKLREAEAKYTPYGLPREGASDATQTCETLLLPAIESLGKIQDHFWSTMEENHHLRGPATSPIVAATYPHAIRHPSRSGEHSSDIERGPAALEHTLCLADGIQNKFIDSRGEDGLILRNDCDFTKNSYEYDTWIIEDNSPGGKLDQYRDPKFLGARSSDSLLERWADVVYLLLHPDELACSRKPPPDLGIHQAWLIAKHRNDSKVDLSSASGTISVGSGPATSRHSTYDSGSLYIKSNDHPLQKYVMDPTGRKPMVWGLIGAIFITYDAVTLPLAFFNLPENALQIFSQINIITLSYWVLDVIVQMLLGFRTHGRIDLRPDRVIRRYVTTWFAPDLFLICLDLILLFLTSFKGISSMRLLRILRVMRLLRLVRIRRLNTVMIARKQFIMNVNSENIHLIISLLQNVFLVLLVTHYIACIWFYVGWASAARAGYDSSWIAWSAIEAADVGTQYALAFHWSLTQFSPATNNINPQNAIERAFACVVVMFAMVAFSSFISSVTSTVAQIRQVNAKRFAEEGLIKNFIHDRQISLNLAYDIMQFFRSNFNRTNERVHEMSIKTFAALPERILWRLHEEMYRHMWISNPLFFQFIGRDDRLIAKLSHETVSLQQYVAQQDAFCDESICLQVYYVTDGVSQYHVSAFRLNALGSHIPRMSSKADFSLTTIRSGAWLSEMAFWVPWHHQGGLTCSSNSEFACINCEKFGMAISTYGGMIHHMISVLAIYIIGYAESRIDNGHRLTDLPMDEFEAEEIASRVAKFFGRSGNVDKVRGSIG